MKYKDTFFAAAMLLFYMAASAQTNTHRIVPIAPMTKDVEVLFGDPDKPGEPFVMRIREIPGGIIPPHRHLVDEHITVVQGRIFFSVGGDFQRASLKEVKAGGYIFIPKGSVMFGYTPEAAIVQVHGVGPFNIHWRVGSGFREGLTTLDSPNAKAVFAFNRDDRVKTPRGRGRISQAYDNGEYIAYELYGDDGVLFMAEECEIEGAVPRPSIVRACFSKMVWGTEPVKVTHRSH